MPGSFLGELAAVAGFGPFNLRSAPATAPFMALPPAPKPETPRAADPTADVVFLPPPKTTTETTETRQASPFDVLTEFGAFQPFDFGPMVAYQSPTAALPALPVPTPTNGDTSFESVLPAPPMPDAPDNSVTPLSEPTSPPPPPTSPPSQPLTASDDSYSTIHSRQLIVPDNGVLDNDYSSTGSTLYTVLVTDVSHGVLEDLSSDLSFALSGGFRYTPEPEFVGTDSFTYYVTDGQYNSEPATVTIQVTNAAPTAATDSYTTTEDGILEVGSPGGPLPSGGSSGVLSNDADADPDAMYPVLITGTLHGGLDLRPDGGFTYAPNPNFSGTDTFTYKASDGIADSQPVTATITVTPRQGADLDGQDPSTDGNWMSEGDEQKYGLVVTAGSASVMARAPVAPAGAGWAITTRRLSWDSNSLVVGGITSPGYIDLPLSGDRVYSVAALNSPFNGSTISYLETWENVLSGSGINSICMIQAVAQTAKIDSVDFTTDHNVLLKNGGLEEVGKDATRYASTEWIRAFGKPPQPVNSPFTHSRDKKIEATVKWSSAGIAAQTPYRLEGVVTYTAGFPTQGAMKFVANSTTAGDANTTNVITDIPLSKAMGIWTFSVAWKVILNPGTAQEKTLDMGDSGEHKVYQTYANPRGTGEKSGRATEPRMQLATSLYAGVYITATMSTGTFNPDPKPARLIYTLLKQHVFTVSRSEVHVTESKIDESRAWRVPGSWLTGGCNCISGALFVQKASYMVGMPGTINVKMYAASVANVNVAIEIKTAAEARDGDRVRDKNKPNENVALHFAGNQNNVFEGTVLYTPAQAAATLYMPSGVDFDALYDTKDKVITVFNSFEWAKKVIDPMTQVATWKKTGVPQDVLATYQTAASLPLSKLDE